MSLVFEQGRHALEYARLSAAKRGLSWHISKSLYRKLLSNPCFYCRLPIPRLRGGYGLERLNNSVGYEPWNVVQCCPDCNLARGNRFTVSEMCRFIGPAIRALKLSRSPNRPTLAAPASWFRVPFDHRAFRGTRTRAASPDVQVRNWFVVNHVRRGTGLGQITRARARKIAL